MNRTATSPGYRLPVVTANSPLSPSRARARVSAYTPKRGNQVVTGNRPPSVNVTILKHCRCIDCRKFFKTGKVEGEYCCRDGIGGTKVVWGTGERICDPPPEAWHYCAGYHGPQISKDVWVWPKGSHKVYLPKPWRRQAAQVGAGVNVASNPANLATDAKERNGGDQSEER